MRRAALVAAVAIILASSGYLLHGQAQSEAPEAVYRECQKLQAQIEKADEEIRSLEYQSLRARKAKPSSCGLHRWGAQATQKRSLV